MAALAANTAKIAGGTFIARPSSKTFIVKSSSTVYQGSLVGIEHATGHIVPLDDAADRSYCGVSLGKLVGDGSAEIGVNGLATYATSVAVTGLSAQTKVPQPVYATTDNDLTLTRPSDDAVCVGIAVKYISSGVGDVLFFGHAIAAAAGLCGGLGKRRLVLAYHTFATFTNAYDLRFTLWGHGLVTEIGVMPAIIASTSSKTALLTGSLGSTAITTGALTLTTAGLATAGTPQKVNPTALNEFHDGDIIKLVGSAVTAFSEGSGYVYLDVEYLP